MHPSDVSWPVHKILPQPCQPTTPLPSTGTASRPAQPDATQSHCQALAKQPAQRRQAEEHPQAQARQRLKLLPHVVGAAAARFQQGQSSSRPIPARAEQQEKLRGTHRTRARPRSVPTLCPGLRFCSSSALRASISCLAPANPSTSVDRSARVDGLAFFFFCRLQGRGQGQGGDRVGRERGLQRGTAAASALTQGGGCCCSEPLLTQDEQRRQESTK
jgi:hypothetical protein